MNRGIPLRRAAITDKLFVFAVFIWFIVLHRLDNPLSYLFYEGGPEVTLASSLLIGSFVVHRVFGFRSRLAAVCKSNWPLWALVLLSLVSVTWSIDPQVTIISSLKLVSTTLFGLYLVVVFDREELLRLLIIIFAGLALLSIGIVMLWPQLGIFQAGYHVGNWRGPYFSKHLFGIEMLLGMLVWSFAASLRVFPRWVAFLGLAVFFFLVGISGSRTAWILLAIYPLIFTLLRVLRWNFLIGVPALIVGTIAAGYVGFWTVEQIDTIFELVGRDVTLTSRVDLWKLLIEIGAEHNILGVGYGAFWFGLEGRSEYSLYLGRLLRWPEVLHAHNILLDIWLQLGIVGLALFIYQAMLAFWKGIRAYMSTGYPTEAFGLTVLTICLVDASVDSLLFSAHNALWVFYVFSTSLLMTAPSKTPSHSLAVEPDQREGPRPPHHLTKLSLSP